MQFIATRIVLQYKQLTRNKKTSSFVYGEQIIFTSEFDPISLLLEQKLEPYN